MCNNYAVWWLWYQTENMIDDEIRQGICSATVDTTFSDLKKFQDFLHWKASMIDKIICGHCQIKLVKFMWQLKLIKLLHRRTSQNKISGFLFNNFSIRKLHLQCCKGTITILGALLPKRIQNQWHRVLLQRLQRNLHWIKINMSHTTWIPYSLTFLCKKPLTITSFKFTQKLNFHNFAVKPFSWDYCSKWT